MFAILEATLNLLYPKICLGCSNPGAYICATCLHKSSNINLIQKCHVCGNEARLGLTHRDCKDKSYLDGLIYPLVYNKLIRTAIVEGKYNLVSDIFTDFAKVITQYLQSFYKLSATDSIITFVPLNKFKQRLRGFNQADLIARKVAFSLGIECSNILERTMNTKTQVGMHEFERQSNLKNVFQVKKLLGPEVLAGKHIYLIDDIYTTGTTMNECARVLKQGGAQSVTGVVFAKSKEWKMRL